MSNVTGLEVVQNGSPRRWTLEEKLRIIEGSFAAGNASAVAGGHGLSTSQLFAWRKQAREGALGAMEGFAAALMVSPMEPVDRNAAGPNTHSGPTLGGGSAPARPADF
jgi:transposase